MIGLYYSVYNELGPGFLESVYEAAMAVALEDAGLAFDTQVKIPVWFRGRSVGDYRADIVVADTLLLELKASQLTRTCPRKPGTQLFACTQLELALLLNFGPKPEFRRLVYSNARKQ